MKNKIYVVALIAASLTFMGCNDDFMERAPKTSLKIGRHSMAIGTEGRSHTGITTATLMLIRRLRRPPPAVDGISRTYVESMSCSAI